jgi:hypothetical protein
MRSHIRPVFVASVAFAALSSLALGGCAKVPNIASSDNDANQKLLRVRFTLRGQVAPVNAQSGRQNYYFILVNLTDDINAPGPVPQLAPPYANGIAVARIPENVGMVGFVQYGGGLNQPRLFRAPRDVNSPTNAPTYQRAEESRYSDYQDIGIPNTFSVQGQVIDVTFDLNRLRLDAPVGGTRPALPQYAQINIITTDNVPSGSATDQPKLWDAMGDGRSGQNTQNTYITVPLAQSSAPITSGQSIEAGEPTDNDVRDRNFGGPVESDSLDITDWLIQVR